MTATTSTKKSSYFGTRFKNTISQNKRNFIVHCILELLGLPVLAVIALAMTYADSTEISDAEKTVINNACVGFTLMSVFVLIVCVFLGMTFALNCFNYLYKKHIVDMNYALPLNGTQRFFADYLAGFTMYIVPTVVAVLLSLGILGIGTPFIEGMGEFWKVVPSLLKFVAVALIAMLLFYTLCVLAITFCGNTFEAIFSIFAFNILIPASIACVWLALCSSASYGISSESILINNFLLCTSPIGAVIFTFYSSESMYIYRDYESSSFVNALFTKWCIITLIVIAIYLVISYFLYRNRKAEDVSKPYVYKSAFYIMMTMAVFCILSLFISTDGFIGAGFAICAVLWFVMEVITRRGFKKFWQAGLGFTGAVVSVFLVCYVFNVTDGMGMTKKVPSAKSVESVSIYSSDLLDYHGYSFKDKTVIEETTKLHQELVDRHYKPDEYDYIPFDIRTENSIHSDCYLRFNYSTYTGSSIMREYYLPTNMCGDLVKAILLSDDYAKIKSDELYSRYSPLEGFNTLYTTETITFDLKGVKTNYHEIDESEAVELREAYYNDFIAMTENNLLNDEYIGSFDNGFFVLSSFENTISFLEKIGVEIEPIEKNLAFNVELTEYPEIYSLAEYDFEYDEKKVGGYLSGYEEYMYYNRDEKYSTLDSMTSISDGYYAISDNTSVADSKLIELINRGTPIIINEKPLAILHVNRTKLYLLDRNDNKQLLDEYIESKSSKFKLNFTVGGMDENPYISTSGGWDE